MQGRSRWDHDGKKVWPPFKIDGKHSFLRGDRDEEGIAGLVWGSLNNASVMFTHTCCHSNGIRGDLEGDFMGRGYGWGVLLHSEMPQGSLGLGRAVEIPTDSGMLTTCRPWGASHPHVTQPNSANEVVWKFSQLFQPFHESCPQRSLPLTRTT